MAFHNDTNGTALGTCVPDGCGAISTRTPVPRWPVAIAPNLGYSRLVVNHKSIGDIPEAQLVDGLLASPSWRENLLSIYGFPAHPTVATRVPLPNGARGDVDLLVCDKAHPESAVAIEVKRIKVTNGKINKLKEHLLAVRQANRLANARFSQVWLYILIVVDSRVQNLGKQAYEGLKQKETAEIAAATSLLPLEPSIGVIHWDFVQSMDYEPLTVGAYGGRILRMARTVEQPREITEWVSLAIAEIP